MGSEEVLSVRAGLQPRTKRRGHDRVNLRQSSGNFVANGGDRGSSGDGWFGAIQGRMEDRQNARSRGPTRHQKSTSHGGIWPRDKRSNRPHQRSASAVVSTGRSTGSHHANMLSARGGSSVGVGGMLSGGGSVGNAVHTAAVESVEVFLGDFVPNAAEPPAVATLLSAGSEEKGVGGGQTGVGGVVVKKLSKWAAIGRGGKISARATAVCIEEVRVQKPAVVTAPVFRGTVGTPSSDTY